MTTRPACSPSTQPTFDATALQTADRRMGEGLMRTDVHRPLLVANGRTVDMAGLDRGVGLLCAKALDLPPEAGAQPAAHPSR